MNKNIMIALMSLYLPILAFASNANDANDVSDTSSLKGQIESCTSLGNVGDVINAQQRACLNALYKKQDQQLNQAYQQIISSPLIQNTFDLSLAKDYQRLWVHQRNQACGDPDLLSEEDRTIRAWVCLIEKTGQQVSVLKQKIPVSDQCLDARCDYDLSCLKSLYVQVDQRLNQVYKAVMKHKLMDSQTKERLLLEQRAWLDMRDESCDIGNLSFVGETNFTACLTNNTASQTNVLLNYQKALDLRASPLPENPFNGLWEYCFFLDDRGKSYCVYKHIYQNEDQLTVIEEEFTSYRISFYHADAQVDESSSLEAIILPRQTTQSNAIYKICNNHQIFETFEGKTCEELIAADSYYYDRVFGYEEDMKKEVNELLEEVYYTEE